MIQSKNNLFQNAFSMISSGIVQAGVGFISNLILVRFITPSEFGVFAIVLANATLLSALFNFRIGDLILRSSEEGLKNNLGKYCSFIFFQSLFTGVGGGLILYFGNHLTTYAILALLAIIIGPFIQLQVYLFERKLKYTNIAVIESGSHLGSHLIAVLGVFAGWGALVLYLRILIQPLFVFIGLWWKKGLSQLKFEWNSITQLSDVVKDGKWLWADNMLEQLIDRLIIIFANFLVPIASIGFFFQAKRLAVTPHQLLQPFTTRVMLNYFSQSDEEEKSRLLNRTILLELIILFSVVIFLFFFGHPIIVFLFGSSWEPVSDILIGLFGVIAFLSVFNTYKAYHIANKSLNQFIKYGRAIFILVLVISFSLFYFYLPSLSDVMKIAGAISVAYLFAVILLSVSYYSKEK